MDHWDLIGLGIVWKCSIPIPALLKWYWYQKRTSVDTHHVNGSIQWGTMLPPVLPSIWFTQIHFEIVSVSHHIKKKNGCFTLWGQLTGSKDFHGLSLLFQVSFNTAWCSFSKLFYHLLFIHSYYSLFIYHLFKKIDDKAGYALGCGYLVIDRSLPW